MTGRPRLQDLEQIHRGSSAIYAARSDQHKNGAMAPPRIKSRLYVEAYLHCAQAGGGFVTLVHKGDDDAGAILVKLFISGQYTQLFRQDFNMEGMRLFTPVFPELVAENLVDQTLSRERNIDPDVWVIEVQHPEGKHFLDLQSESVGSSL